MGRFLGFLIGKTAQFYGTSSVRLSQGIDGLDVKLTQLHSRTEYTVTGRRSFGT